MRARKVQDLIPDGSIPLVEAFATFRARKWGDELPEISLQRAELSDSWPKKVAWERGIFLGKIVDADTLEMTSHFEAGDLRALVRPLGASENFSISPAAWASNFYAEEAFGTEVLGHSWEEFYQRSPFTPKADFDHWLDRFLQPPTSRSRAKTRSEEMVLEFLSAVVADGSMTSTESDRLRALWRLPSISDELALLQRFDPLSEPVWTLPMAVAWIAERSTSSVREQWDKFRAATGQGPASMVLMEVVSEPLATLRREFEAGRLIATGIDVQSGKPAPIQKSDWTALTLTYDDAYNDLWRYSELMGAEAYRNVTVEGADIQRIWPMQSNRQEVPTRVTFDGEEQDYSLFEAAAFVATEGAGGAIMPAELEEAAGRIFRELANPESTLQARGARVDNLRMESVPADRWLFVTFDRLGRGHWLNWMDRNSPIERDTDWVAALTEYDADTSWDQRRPTWTDIRIRAIDLKRAFQANLLDDAGSIPIFSGTAAQKRAAAMRRLVGKIAPLIEASPRRRTHTKADLLPMAVAEGLGERALKEALAEARKKVPNNNWADGGAPRLSE